MKDKSEADAQSKREAFKIPEDHRAAVLEGLREADRAEYATDADMAALWKRCGL
ncbi:MULTISPECIES: hypothetical protein [unclassified Bradyrhizobium]|uniref:hypothetical protein n=1 Tax=unclassified Bradyrhizobium TaxID=2631580 RepID=UPI001CD4891D|nr:MULTISPECIES: hypothetical protein [unclassified Bradyrhizobium]MCA1428813.1 hypothetical protein [Bradyrhizobium sp. NBAIM16]MCA1476899.1 hypothetical protein [Bradyrhizobium sp. NBAIM08]MCA1508209.1 hypothetical protein [Bradyrhizobium sp. NBAIM02]